MTKTTTSPERLRRESTAEQAFYHYLLAQGIPARAIIQQPRFAAVSDRMRYRPDFGLLDPRNRELLAVIEVKASHQDLLASAAHVAAYVSDSGARSARGFLATPEGADRFLIYAVGRDGDIKPIPDGAFQWESLITARAAEAKHDTAIRKKRTLDHFFLVCYGAAFVAFGLAVADLFVLKRYGIKLLTSERMMVLAVSLGLTIAPFLQKFKALGVEIERASKPGATKP